MNVLSKGKVPKVMDLAELLQASGSTIAATCWCGAPSTAWRRSSTGSKSWAAILVAYLNLDKVIKIIRNEDEPKPVLIKAFKLSDVQADAILNMRLRNLRKLEEMEIKRENKDLREEKTGSKS